MVRFFRRIAVAFVGGIVLAVGVVMVVLPGPAVVVIPAGLAILATEFAWARHLLHRVREPVERGLSLFKRITARERSRGATTSPGRDELRHPLSVAPEARNSRVGGGGRIDSV
jgi:tellurite resistance protein TerC